MPKSNGYQSIHTTVLCGTRPLEIQIRTNEMHAVAEHGVASHWLYKKGMNKDLVDIDSLTIINQLKELRKDHLTDSDFFNEIKSELLGDSIFVFTPKGEVRKLPFGSTAIDFAYSIHTHIGETITFKEYANYRDLNEPASTPDRESINAGKNRTGALQNTRMAYRICPCRNKGCAKNPRSRSSKGGKRKRNAAKKYTA